MTDQELAGSLLAIPDPEERARMLDAACAGDRRMRRRVEKLVQAARRPAAASVPAPPNPAPVAVFAAAALWLFVGFGLPVAPFLPDLAALDDGKVRQIGPVMAQGWVPVAFAVGFLLVGSRTLTGKAHDTVGPGFVGFVLGVGCAVVGVAEWFDETDGFGADWPAAALLLAGIGGVVGAAAALFFRYDYLRWRQIARPDRFAY